MTLNDFINNHMINMKFTSARKKLIFMQDVYTKLGNYFRIIQDEKYSLIFYILSEENYIHYSLVNDILTNINYKKCIEYLCKENFIEKLERNKINKYFKNRNGNLPNVYILTKKGKDFINYKHIKNYLELLEDEN